MHSKSDQAISHHHSLCVHRSANVPVCPQTQMGHSKDTGDKKEQTVGKDGPLDEPPEN